MLHEAFAEVDPITQVYKALRAQVLAEPRVAALFRIGNVPDLSASAPLPIKANVQDADLPELVIAVTGGSFAVARTNTDHAMTKRFTFRVATAQLSVNTKFFPAQWALFCAFCRMQRQASKLNLPFVERIKILDGQDFVSKVDDAERGNPGWCSLMTLEITLRFADSDLVLTKA